MSRFKVGAKVVITHNVLVYRHYLNKTGVVGGPRTGEAGFLVGQHRWYWIEFPNHPLVPTYFREDFIQLPKAEDNQEALEAMLKVEDLWLS